LANSKGMVDPVAGQVGVHYGDAEGLWGSKGSEPGRRRSRELRRHAGHPEGLLATAKLIPHSRIQRSTVEWDDSSLSIHLVEQPCAKPGGTHRHLVRGAITMRWNSSNGPICREGLVEGRVGPSGGHRVVGWGGVEWVSGW